MRPKGATHDRHGVEFRDGYERLGRNSALIGFFLTSKRRQGKDHSGVADREIVRIKMKESVV
jgi:hypothetical protein